MSTDKHTAEDWEALEGKCETQAQEIAKLRATVAKLVSDSEAEEEFLMNKLLKRLDAIKNEREKLALEVDREEEFLTNTLQRQLHKVQKEKQDLENKLEAEQEYLVNKLQTQMMQMKAENVELERKLEEDQAAIEELNEQLRTAAGEREKMASTLRYEEEVLIPQLKEQLRTVRGQKAEIENQLEAEQEAIVLRLQKQLHQAQREKSSASTEQQKLIEKMTSETEALRARHNHFQQTYAEFKKKDATLQQELRKLQDENFVLLQRLQEERAVAESVKLNAARMTTDFEVDSERSFHSRSRASSVASSSHDEFVTASPASRPTRTAMTPTVLTLGDGEAATVKLGAELSPGRHHRPRSPRSFLAKTPLSEQLPTVPRTSSFSRTLVDSPREPEGCAVPGSPELSRPTPHSRPASSSSSTSSFSLSSASLHAALSSSDTEPTK